MTMVEHVERDENGNVTAWYHKRAAPHAAAPLLPSLSHKVMLGVSPPTSRTMPPGSLLQDQFGPCGCVGPKNGEPLCPCQMRGVQIKDGRYVRITDLGPAPCPGS